MCTAVLVAPAAAGQHQAPRLPSRRLASRENRCADRRVQQTKINIYTGSQNRVSHLVSKQGGGSGQGIYVVARAPGQLDILLFQSVRSDTVLYSSRYRLFTSSAEFVLNRLLCEAVILRRRLLAGRRVMLQSVVRERNHRVLLYSA